MRDKKKILLILIVFILVLSISYLTYLLQDGSNPLINFNSRASTSNTDDLFGEEVTEDPLDEELSALENELTYNSTSPTATPSGSLTPSATISATLSPSISPGISPTVTMTPTPTLTPTATPILSPTAVQQLPVAGATDHLPWLLGGGALILLALLF